MAKREKTEKVHKGKKREREPQYYTSKINTKVLNYNVYIMKFTEKILYMVLFIIIGGLVGLVFYGGLFKDNGEPTTFTVISNTVVFFVAGASTVAFFMPTLNEALRKKRLSKLKLQFRDFLIALSNAMSGGMNVSEAIANASKDLESQYSSEAYMVTEAYEIIGCMQNNIPLEEALTSFGMRSGVDDIKNFAIVFATCYRTGGNLKEVIRRTTDIISEKMIINEEIETKITSNKVQMMAMNVIPIFIIMMLRFMSSSFSESFASAIGIIAMTIGVGLFISAYKVGQKIMDIKG